jgi:hypothetical protein
LAGLLVSTDPGAVKHPEHACGDAVVALIVIEAECGVGVERVEPGGGIILYLPQEAGRRGLTNKIRTYHSQDDDDQYRKLVRARCGDSVMGRILIPLIPKAESERAAEQETVLQHAREHVKTGELAATTPWTLGYMHLLPIAIEFLDSYPDIALRLVLTDRVVNTVSESIDVAIRIGTVPDSSMMAIRIGSVVAFASPAYLAAHSHPKNPSDLSTMIVLQQMTWPLPARGSSRAAIEKLSRLSDRD